MEIKIKYYILLFFVTGGISLSAQTFNEQYKIFRKEARQQYEDFRKKANQEYADFMQQTWKAYQALPAIPKPKNERPQPPIVYVENEQREGQNENVPLPYKEIVRPTTPPQPVPISPIEEQKEPTIEYLRFAFFGTPCQVRLGNAQRFKLTTCNKEALADAWQRLSRSTYNNVLRDCLELRIRLQLCDWAYLLMLQELSFTFLGKDTNEATLFIAYLFCQSGYEMKLAEANGKLYMLYRSEHTIYELPYWVIDGKQYYPINNHIDSSIQVCQANYPNEQPLSLLVTKELRLMVKETKARTLQAEAYPDMKVSVYTNQNLLDFMATYPTSTIGENFCTRWAMYAETPLSQTAMHSLYITLRKAISGKTQAESANKLINFVQTALVYEYDDKVWGQDRAFFADETLYYPYCDCEDRAILFTRLVRDLLGLETALVYYPGHLATAIHFTENVNGDYLLINGKRYLICDPTYIGAPIGKTMPDMNNKEAKVILLN